MSQQDLSEDTKVVLLLCGRFGGEKQEAYQPLANKEYGELGRVINQMSFVEQGLGSQASQTIDAVK